MSGPPERVVAQRTFYICLKSELNHISETKSHLCCSLCRCSPSGGLDALRPGVLFQGMLLGCLEGPSSVPLAFGYVVNEGGQSIPSQEAFMIGGGWLRLGFGLDFFRSFSLSWWFPRPGERRGRPGCDSLPARNRGCDRTHAHACSSQAPAVSWKGC